MPVINNGTQFYKHIRDARARFQVGSHLGNPCRKRIGKIMAEEIIQKKSKTSKYVNLAIEIGDDVILGVVALGTVALAVVLLVGVTLEFASEAQHNYPYVLSELMFVLIIMELFRQVLRQINHEPFSLNPFLTIAMIASVRGLLIIQMKIGTKEFDWNVGAIGIMACSLTVLFIMISFFLYNRSRPAS